MSESRGLASRSANVSENLWVFGETALAEQGELARLAREALGYALALERPTPELRELIDTLRVARDKLRAAAPDDLRPRVGDNKDSDGRVYIDHSRAIGDYNPCFPVYELVCADDRASGFVEFPIIYEGPPGIAHGGFIAVLFDCVLQQLNCDLGLAGKTAKIEVRYRRPTPLNTRLAITAWREVADDRIHSTAQLHHGEVMVAEAQMSAVAGRREGLPAVSPRRPS